MTKRGSENRKLPGQVLVRMTREQQNAVQQCATADQVSAATWMRQLIADSLNVPRGPIVTWAHPPALVLEVACLREVVAELGGAMVQAAIISREDGRTATHEEIESLIPRVKSAVRSLDDIKEALWPPAA